MRNLGVTILLLAALVSPAAGQRRPLGPPPVGPRSRHAPEQRRAFHHDAVRAFRELVKSRESEATLVRRFDRIAYEVSARASEEDLERLRRLSPAKRVQAILDLWDALLRRQDDDFLAGLSESEAKELRALDPASRRRRIRELRAEDVLERAIRLALTEGVISEEKAQALRETAVEEKPVAAHRLYKTTFLTVWRDRITPPERSRLEALPPAEFWRDPVVRRFRLRGFLSKQDEVALRKLSRAQRGQLLEALRSGGGLQALRKEGVLGAELVAKLSSLDPEDMRFLGFQLERVVFRRRPLLGLPRFLMKRMTMEERRAFLTMSSEERSKFLSRRFPNLDLEAFKVREEAARRLEALLETLPPQIADRVRRPGRGPLRAALERWFRNEPSKVGEILDLLKTLRPPRRSGPGHPPGPRPPRRR
ncbi:MAG TPA: hypothetical protein ENK43_05220 [Planctomycetes bacterium]|nr:hypothetical protein [Planctomycetota bacterium]